MVNDEILMDLESEEGNFYEDFNAWLVLKNIKAFFDAKYKYLPLLDNMISNHTSARIPLISHNTWLTTSSAIKEVPNTHFDKLIQKLKLLDQDNLPWKHIFWTNCKICIPNTIERISSFNLEVREIQNEQDKILHYHLINDFLSQGYMGIAANLLRYDILDSQGGFYSDLNFVLLKSPLEYMQKFDFFSTSFTLYIGNHCFGTVPNHPIIHNTLNSIDKNIDNPTSRIIKAQGNSIESYTEELTYAPLIISFFINSNQHHTKDIAIPLGRKLLEQIQSLEPVYERPLTEFNNHKILLWENEICLADHLDIGYDEHDGGSWLGSVIDG